MGRYMVFNIGCIECGVSSDVVGVYESEEEADAVARLCESKLHGRQGGLNDFEVFDLSAPQANEYAEVLSAAQ
jgi:hypothetical protein